ncbi:MAG: polysaccharide biosynthesis protein [Ignavibacteriae bacterium]|nr:polysaccharide biosynthesis protein [Ignavibacteriota bacterium]
MFMRLDGDIDLDKYGTAIIYSTVVFSVIKLTVFYFFDLYRRFWATASIDELARLIYIAVNTVLIESIVFVILRSFHTLPFFVLPFSFPFIESTLVMLLVASARFSIRFFERIDERRVSLESFGAYVLIVGAGSAGASVAQELQKNNNLKMTPVAFLDDDPSKLKLRIRGVPVVGKIDDMGKIARQFKIKKVIIAIPTASGKVIRNILETARLNNLETLTVPGINEILGGKVDIGKLRKIQIQDLLRRLPIKTDIQKVNELLKGKIILLTGAGGSIGSELCRQILKSNPSKLIILGHGENSIFEIEEELKFIKDVNILRKIVHTNIISRIADIKDFQRLDIIFEEFKPDVIFHAAAHKHVPLMENNPSEVVTNNLLGTRNLINCSVKYGVQNFILISSDKAVNSTNLMGVSKRVAEMIVLKAALEHSKNFKAVRFGNVLGSRGSVIKTFQRQLERGGPLTITHPEITRYFMTIPEAVQLVLQASVLGKGGEIFVLDMGEPVKILDLAKDVIRLAGLEEGIDVDIEFTGLRPGEKMFEELFKDGEDYLRTEHDKIMFAKNSSSFIPSDLEQKINNLIENCNKYTPEEIVKAFAVIVPEFTHQSIEPINSNSFITTKK